MGNVESIFGDSRLSNLPDQKEIYNKTQTTAILMKRIIDFILQNADIRDTISLATTKGCSQWLILAKSEIENLLTEIEVEPTLGNGGILYLEKINKFIPPKNSGELTREQKKKQRENPSVKEQYCTVIAFFSIRLFQVVGALALSVLDSDIPINNYGINGRPTTTQTRVKQDRSVNGIFGFRQPKKTRRLGDTISSFENSISRFTDNIGSKVSNVIGKVFQRGGGNLSGIFSGFYLKPISNSNTDSYLYNFTTQSPTIPSSFIIIKYFDTPGKQALDKYIVKSDKKVPFEFVIEFKDKTINLINFKYEDKNKNLVYIGKKSLDFNIIGDADIITRGYNYTDTQKKLRELWATIYNNTEYPDKLTENSPEDDKKSYDFKIENYVQFEKLRIFMSNRTSVASKMPKITINFTNDRKAAESKDLGAYIEGVVDEINNQSDEFLLVVFKKFKYIIENRSGTGVYNIFDPNQADKKTSIYITNRNYSDGNPLLFYKTERIIANKKYLIKMSFKVKFEASKPSDLLYLLSFIDDIRLTVQDMSESGKIIRDSEIMETEYTEKDDNKEPKKKFKFSLNPDDEPVLKDYRFNKNMTIPTFLDKIFSELNEELVDDDIEASYINSKDGFKPPIRDTDLADTDNPIKYSELWKQLSKKGTPIKSFCVARALQLLNAEGLQSNVPAEIYPMVFNLKFPFVENSSLPKPGESITSAAPIKALETLFVKPSIKYTKEQINFGNDYDRKRKESLANILGAFGNIQAESLSKLNELKATEIVSINDATKIYDLRLKAIRMFEVQFNHTRKVNDLLKEIFTFEKGISVKTELLSKGVRGIEEIAVKARDLLVDYYSKCQTAYSEGVKILQDTRTNRVPVNNANT